jgi:hypothetical protein
MTLPQGGKSGAFVESAGDLQAMTRIAKQAPISSSTVQSPSLSLERSIASSSSSSSSRRQTLQCRRATCSTDCAWIDLCPSNLRSQDDKRRLYRSALVYAQEIRCDRPISQATALSLLRSIQLSTPCKKWNITTPPPGAVRTSAEVEPVNRHRIGIYRGECAAEWQNYRTYSRNICSVGCPPTTFGNVSRASTEAKCLSLLTKPAYCHEVRLR